jgi:uncharacterized protein (TIGR03437 family)
MRIFRFSFAAAACLALALAQQLPGPFIYMGRTLNAASLMPQGLPGGGVARGSMFSIFGERLGPAGQSEATSLPLAPLLNGVGVTLTRGNFVANAWPVFVSPSQINAILPSSLEAGTYTLRVVIGGSVRSNPVQVLVTDFGPGIFTEDGSGMGPAMLSGVTVRGSQTASGTKPMNIAREKRPQIRPGQAASIWMTGLGAISRSDNQAPPVSEHPYLIEAWVGGKRVATRLYAGRAPALPGIDQYVFTVPSDSPEGCFVPVQVRVNGQFVSNTATIAVSKSGGNFCEDEAAGLNAEMHSDTVSVAIYRSSTIIGEGQTAVADLAIGKAVAEVGHNLRPFNPYLAPPPAGSCATYHGFKDLLRGGLQPLQGPEERGLNLGAITLTNGTVRSVLERVPGLQGLFSSVLGTRPPGDRTPLLTDARDIDVSTAGGPDAGAMRARAERQPSIDANNLSELRTLSPGDALDLQFEADAAQVAIFGGAYDMPSNSSTVFVCVAPVDTTEFSVPGHILANLPAPRQQTAQQELFVGMGAARPELLKMQAAKVPIRAAVGNLIWKQINWVAKR